MERRIAIALALVAATPPLAAGGEEAKGVDTTLDEVVVTATRTEKSIADAPGSVSIVTAEEMKKRNIQSVDQALTLLPGVFVNRSKSLMNTTAAATLRGMPLQGRTLIMMDGVPINDAYSSGVLWGGLYAEDLSRIEVVRGASSSLYGGNAMGGVINLLSTMPNKREITFNSGYGSGLEGEPSMDNLWKVGGSYGDRIGKLKLYTSFRYRSTDGYPAGLTVVSAAPTAASGISGATPTTDNKGAKRYLIGDSGNNGWWDYGASFRAQYDFTDTNYLRFSWQRNSNKYTYGTAHSYLRDASGNPVYSYTNGKATISESNFLSGEGGGTQDIYTISGEALVGDLKGKFTFSILDQNENWYISPTTSGTTRATLDSGPGKLSESPNRTYFTDLQISKPIREKHLLTGGLSFRYDYADSTDTALTDWRHADSTTGSPTYWSGGAATTYSAYLQAEIALLDNLTLFAGVRDDYWVSFDGYAGQVASSTTNAFSDHYKGQSRNSVSPKGAIVFKPLDGTILRVSGGKAFRAPTIYQQYKTWSSKTASTETINQGNPDLKPETVWSWDGGVEQTLWRGAKAKATYFENYLDDMMYNLTIGTTSSGGITTTTKRQMNVGAAESKGVELEFEQCFGKWLRIFSTYTYTNTRVTENKANPALEGKQLTQVPRHNISGGFDASYGPASLFMSGRYIAKRFGSDDNSDTAGNAYTTYDSYFVMDLKAGYTVTDWATFSFSIDNLLDRKYYSYYPAPGRSWFASLDLKF